MCQEKEEALKTALTDQYKESRSTVKRAKRHYSLQSVRAIMSKTKQKNRNEKTKWERKTEETAHGKTRTGKPSERN